MTLATWQETVATAPAAFLIGLGVGWLVSQRYRIIKRNGEPYGRRSSDPLTGEGERCPDDP